MGSKNEVKLAYGLAVVLLIVGIICYAAGSAEPPQEPVRKVYKNMAGDVLFDHMAHTGYESDCYVCHHHGDSDEFMSCTTCHKEEMPATEPSVCKDCHPLSGDMYIHDAHHMLLEDEPGVWSCKDCHSLKEGEEPPPAACGDCHDPYYVEGETRLMTYQKSADALHSQCIGCHEDYGAGPVECNMCHAQ